MMHSFGYLEFTGIAQKVLNAENWSDTMRPIANVSVAELARSGGADAELARAARDLEATFLSIMLREAGAGAPPSAFGGGEGEDQFASFLTDAYARKIAESGGIGLAENIFHALRGRADGPD